MGESVSTVSYRVYDKNGEWRRIARRLKDAIATNIQIDTKYHTLDLSDTEETKNVDVSDADLIIFSYIMSELCALDTKDTIALNVRKILSKINSGSAILFIESKFPKFIQYFSSCRSYIGGLRQINDSGESVDIDIGNLPLTFGKYRKILNRKPRTSSDNIVSKWLAMD